MSDWYIENRQNRELEELRDEMSHAMREASNLRSKLSQVQGGLESRLSQLADAFDAFVELSDIRYDLIGFAPAAEVRRHAGQVLTALASGEQPPGPVREVAGYWLQPAVDALSADGLSEGPLAEAMALDERRTSIFLSLALAALGRRDLVRTEWLETAFGTVAADGTLTRLQRALWTTGARGGFGLDGQKLLLGRIQEPLTASTKNWVEVVEGRAASVRRTGPSFTEVAAQTTARARLSQLKTAVETIAGDTTVREPDRDLAYAAGEPTPDSASAVLRLLISEGSEPERGSLARVAELRTRITNNSEAAAITDDAGKVEELLAADLRQTNEPHLAATALRVVADDVLKDAEELAKTAAGLSPTEVAYEVNRHRVKLLPEGPEPASMAEAVAKINAAAPPLTPRALAGATVITAIGLGVAIGLGIVHPFWIVVGVVIVAVGAHRAWLTRTRITTDQADAAAQLAGLREKTAEAAAELATYKADAPERQKAITADLEVIRKYLA